MESSRVESSSNESKTLLFDKWVLWAHLPHDTDWSLSSYIKVMVITNLEDLVMLQEVIPEKMVKNCMLFLMKKDVNPTWEDPKNKEGGCFSFKIMNKNVITSWNKLLIKMVTNNISKNEEFLNSITGVTISPKKTFCIVKLWMDGVKFQSTIYLNESDYLNPRGCLFKRHLK
tara:strand:- start:422 stop:937 length:516 start_codon:yes stop_codon:yes gene_type:complete